MVQSRANVKKNFHLLFVFVVVLVRMDNRNSFRKIIEESALGNFDKDLPPPLTADFIEFYYRCAIICPLWCIEKVIFFL